MTRTKKTSYPPLNIGTSLMLVIFIILCMIIFAVLSLSSALKDYNYSEKNASRNTSYYEANNQAEILLSKIDAILTENISVEEQIIRLQNLGELKISSPAENNEFSITYTIPMDETKMLQVILNTHPQAEKKYTITTWKQISSTEWTGDESLPVLGSD